MHPLQNLLFIDVVAVRKHKGIEAYSNAAKRYIQERTDDVDSWLGTHTSLIPELSRIAAISIGCFIPDKANPGQIKPHIANIDGQTEKVTMEIFAKRVESFKQHSGAVTFAGYNIKRFDIPMLAKKFLVNGMPVPEWLDFRDKKPWLVPVVDLMESWGFGGDRDYVPLDLLLDALGIATPLDERTLYLEAEVVLHDEGKLFTQASAMAAEHTQQSVEQAMRLALHLHNIENPSNAQNA